MPRTYTCKLRYTEQIQLDIASSQDAATYLFRCNGVRDPNYTGTGHQPKGYDQLSAMFTQSAVIGSRIKAVFICRGALTVDMQKCGIRIQNDTLITNNTITIAESRAKSEKQLGIANSSNGIKTIVKNFSTKKWFHTSDIVAYDSEYAETTAANVPQAAYYAVYLRTTNADVDPAAVDVEVTLEYIVTFFNRPNLAQS